MGVSLANGKGWVSQRGNPRSRSLKKPDNDGSRGSAEEIFSPRWRHSSGPSDEELGSPIRGGDS